MGEISYHYSVSLASKSFLRQILFSMGTYFLVVGAAVGRGIFGAGSSFRGGWRTAGGFNSYFSRLF